MVFLVVLCNGLTHTLDPWQSQVGNRERYKSECGGFFDL